MTAPAGSPALSDRCRTLYEILRQHAAKGGYTPKVGDLLAALQGQGHLSGTDPGVIYHDVVRLVDAGLIRTHGSAKTRTYEVIGVGSTIRRPNKPLSAAAVELFAAAGERVREQRAGWPRPTRESAASYDAAVAAKAFADGRGIPETWVHTAIRPSAPARSLTGCSAAMTAEVRL